MTTSEQTTHFWRTDEIRALREQYPTGGADACILPGRSLSAINAQANRLGMKAPPIKRPDDWFLSRITPEIRAEMLLLAGKRVAWHEVKAMATKWRMTPQGALRRIEAAGATLIPKRVQWTRGQDDMLRALRDQPVRDIAKQLHRATGAQRTANAVYVRMARLGLVGHTDFDGYSANELSRLLGVSNATIWHRIVTGRLPATRREGIRAQGAQSPWLVRPQDAKRMLRDDARLLARARRKGDALWLADIMGEVGKDQPQRRSANYGGVAEYHLGMEVAA